jgi:hypothetical protein
MNPAGYWSLEKCKEDDQYYETRYEWLKNSNTAYCAAFKKGWLDECPEHMIQLYKPKNYWTLERCEDI